MEQKIMSKRVYELYFQGEVLNSESSDFGNLVWFVD
jgi:hypothetical protein